MLNDFDYSNDTQCLNCGCWYPIVNYPNGCPKCLSRHIQIKKYKNIKGIISPLSVIDLTDKLKALY